MAGLVLRATSTSRESAEFAVYLDSTEPFLDHHRPGGHPLLGTVMGLELMARAVSQVAGARTSAAYRFSQVAVLVPIVLTGESTTAFVRVTCSVADSFHCEVETRGDAVVTHFSTTITGVERKLPTPAAEFGRIAAAWPVQTADIYGLFFHGPTFRVIERAGLVDNMLVAEIATGLPDLTSDPDDVAAIDPRLIEACLQTAGLLEVATRSRMMIPSRIDSIDFFAGGTALPYRLLTRARRSTASGGDEAVDIDVFDADGSCWMQVRGYQTLPLPFTSDSRALGNLNAAFHCQPAPIRN